MATEAGIPEKAEPCASLGVLKMFAIDNAIATKEMTTAMEITCVEVIGLLLIYNTTLPGWVSHLLILWLGFVLRHLGERRLDNFYAVQTRACCLS